jgi:hypothetical protein
MIDETYTCCLTPHGDAREATYSIIEGNQEPTTKAMDESNGWGGNNSKPTGRGTMSRPQSIERFGSGE